MNRGTELGKQSLFAAALRSFLRESHPDLDDERFIEQRSDAACAAYIECVRSGVGHYRAREVANAVLYRDIRFSVFDTVFEIVAD